MMAAVATPEPSSKHDSNQQLPNRLPVFFGVRQMNQGIIQIIRLVGGSRGESFTTEKENLGKLV